MSDPIDEPIDFTTEDVRFRVETIGPEQYLGNGQWFTPMQIVDIKTGEPARWASKPERNDV